MAGNRVYNEKLSRLKTEAVKYAQFFERTKGEPVAPMNETMDMTTDLCKAAIMFGSTEALEEVAAERAKKETPTMAQARKNLAGAILRVLTAAPGSRRALSEHLHNLDARALQELLNAVKYMDEEADSARRKLRRGF